MIVIMMVSHDGKLLMARISGLVIEVLKLGSSPSFPLVVLSITLRSGRMVASVTLMLVCRTWRLKCMSFTRV